MSEEQLVYKKKKKKFKIFPIVNAIFFILVSLLILFPMWKVIVAVSYTHLTLPTIA